MNKDFRTHIKRLYRETACFSKADDMHYGIIKIYIHYRNAALNSIHFKTLPKNL